MKEFALEWNGGQKTVQISRSADGWSVTIGEETFTFTREELKRVSPRAFRRGQQFFLSTPSFQGSLGWEARSKAAASSAGLDQAQLRSLFPGKVVRVAVKPGQTLEAGDLVVVMESMKMEYPYKAPKRLRVTSVLVKEGDVLAKGQEFIQSQDESV